MANFEEFYEILSSVVLLILEENDQKCSLVALSLNNSESINVATDFMQEKAVPVMLISTNWEAARDTPYLFHARMNREKNMINVM